MTVKCNGGMVHVGSRSDLGLCDVTFENRVIGILKEQNGKFSVQVKCGAPRKGWFPLWQACVIVLNGFQCLPAKEQQELPEVSA